IFDRLRRRWLVLTPEEWVRQNFVQVLIQEGYPSGLIAQEKRIKVGELYKRFDILVYDTNHKPWLMVECKAPEIQLTEETLRQLLRYHISVPVNYLVITNGNMSYGWRKTGGRLEEMEQLPTWM